MIADVRELTPELALIFRVTHVNNLPWILGNGLHSKASDMQDPDFVEIGNRDLIQRRPAKRVLVGPGETLDSGTRSTDSEPRERAITLGLDPLVGRRPRRRRSRLAYVGTNVRAHRRIVS